MPSSLRSWRRMAILAVAAILPAAGRAAAEPLHAFNVPQQPLATALVQLAVQAGVSMSSRAASGCAPQGHAVFGRLSLQAALTRLLDGTGCTYRMIDPRAVEVVAVVAATSPPILPRAQPR
ncbi:MAG TPA: STN domain-containing protein, partial [Phenylobacterium sp.]